MRRVGRAIPHIRVMHRETQHCRLEQEQYRLCGARCRPGCAIALAHASVVTATRRCLKAPTSCRALPLAPRATVPVRWSTSLSLGRVRLSQRLPSAVRAYCKLASFKRPILNWRKVDVSAQPAHCCLEEFADNVGCSVAQTGRNEVIAALGCPGDKHVIQPLQCLQRIGVLVLGIVIKVQLSEIGYVSPTTKSALLTQAVHDDKPRIEQDGAMRNEPRDCHPATVHELLPVTIRVRARRDAKAHCQVAKRSTIQIQRLARTR